MDDQVAVRVLDCGADLEEERETLVDGRPALPAGLRERPALDQLHGEIGSAVVGDAAVEHACDAGMLEAGEDAAFGEKALMDEGSSGAPTESSFTAARWVKPSPRRSPRKTLPMPPFAQQPAESPAAEGPAGCGRRGRFRGIVDERLDPGAVLAVEQRMGALARREQVGELARESGIVRAPLANEGGARPIVRQLSRFVEESPEPLPTVSGALGQIRLPPGAGTVAPAPRSPGSGLSPWVPPAARAPARGTRGPSRPGQR